MNFHAGKDSLTSKFSLSLSLPVVYTTVRSDADSVSCNSAAHFSYCFHVFMLALR